MNKHLGKKVWNDGNKCPYCMMRLISCDNENDAVIIINEHTKTQALLEAAEELEKADHGWCDELGLDESECGLCMLAKRIKISAGENV